MDNDLESTGEDTHGIYEGLSVERKKNKLPRDFRESAEKLVDNKILPDGNTEKGEPIVQALSLLLYYGCLNKDLSLPDGNTEVPMIMEENDDTDQQTSVIDVTSDVISTTYEDVADHSQDEGVSLEESSMNVKPKSGIQIQRKPPSIFIEAHVLSSITSMLHIHGKFLAIGVALTSVVALWGCFVL